MGVGVDSEGVTSGVGEGVGREGGARDGGGNFVMSGGGDGMRNRVVVRSGVGEGVRREGGRSGVGEGVRREGVRSGVGEGVRREEGVRGVVGGRTLNRGGVKRDFAVLLLVRSESIHHHFARFTLLHDL